jgi:hypothetical protein
VQSMGPYFHTANNITGYNKNQGFTRLSFTNITSMIKLLNPKLIINFIKQNFI